MAQVVVTTASSRNNEIVNTSSSQTLLLAVPQNLNFNQFSNQTLNLDYNSQQLLHSLLQLSTSTDSSQIINTSTCKYIIDWIYFIYSYSCNVQRVLKVLSNLLIFFRVGTSSLFDSHPLKTYHICILHLVLKICWVEGFLASRNFLNEVTPSQVQSNPESIIELIFGIQNFSWLSL